MKRARTEDIPRGWREKLESSRGSIPPTRGTAWRTVQARLSLDLSTWLERYRRELGFSRSEIIVDALERLRLEDLAQLPRRGYWELLHQMRADLWRAQARVHALEAALGARAPGRGAPVEGPRRCSHRGQS
jgi:hypothetical protein